MRKPAWSRTDENRIVVEVAMNWPADSSLDLWSVDLSNPAAAVNLTNTASGSELYPAWSPTDSHVAFFTREGGIHAISATGGGRHTLSLTGTLPAWRRGP